ncbi:dihydropteroate synthase [Dendrosporobacter sp. 1207_IL3150]|uniref:dihydropteroate synthase n=1 Tax=Dendrosporobacter sp. 1207_IL3150 TaxID=3084054 RepID=UPI002FDB496E
MNFNPRVIEITNLKQANYELQIIDCDPSGINIMSPKSIFKTIKLEKIPAREANLLKQTFLAKGGEVAVARGTANLSIDYTDVLICATIKQYKLAVNQLKLQPWGLPRLAQAIEKTLEYNEGFPTRTYEWPDKKLAITPGRTLIMGILNITPDSFSDGGKYNERDSALRRVEEMISDGADIIDVGAESTRPYAGSKKITAEEELERLLPIIEHVLAYSSVPISIDTYKSIVAREALKLGAHIINDVWGLQKDPDMAAVAAQFNVPTIIMHNQEGTSYQRNVMSHVCEELRKSIDIALEAGVERDKIIVDPGIGFGKNSEQNLEVMSQLEQLKNLGCPILLAASRKRFIGDILELPVNDRVEGTGATVAVGIVKGSNIVRVHDVKEMARIAKMTDAMLRSFNNVR